MPYLAVTDKTVHSDAVN